MFYKAKHKQRFSIRKYSFGATSVLLGTLVVGAYTPNVKANDVTNDVTVATTLASSETAATDSSSTESTEVSTPTTASSSVTEASTEPSSTETSASTESSETATEASSAAESTNSSSTTEDSSSAQDTTASSEETKTEASDSTTATDTSASSSQETTVASSEQEGTTTPSSTSQATPTSSTTASSEVASTEASEESATSEAASEAENVETTLDDLKAGQSAAQAGELLNSSIESYVSEKKNTAFRATTDTDAVSVSTWNALVNALNDSSVSNIKVNGNITATATSAISAARKVTVTGADGASLNFGTNLLTTTASGWDLTFDNLNITTGSGRGVIDTGQGNNKITFKDVTHTGNSLFGGATTGTGNNATTSGANTDIVIAGTTTSTVNNAPFVQSYGNSNRQYGVTIQNNGTVLESGAANIHDAKSVTIEEGASFTLNRSSIGDGIKLVDGGSVSVGDKATFTVNLNTNNATDSARYHNAGIFMENGGSFTSGRESKVTFNTSIGQAISIGADRPGIAVTDRDRFGGYTANQSRNAGPASVQLGEYSTFNFTGRDGIILGNNSKFVSGEYSKVHFQNKGNGVALDLANDSNITISKHSDTLFESDGKGNKSGSEGSDAISGSYNAYNYIGVNEAGNILIDEYATFRVVMTNRGANPWDDVISLDSRKATTTASFTSKKGAIVDIRDDNTNFYAELISFPLGAANSTIDIQDPLYVNLQRYTAGGSIDGWMPVGGTEILKTDNKNYGNLIYMGGTKGVLKIGGTDYVVYQQIKSDDAKQIWLNVNSMTSPKHGFNAADTYNNNVNPDMSITGIGLTPNVAANNVKDNNTSPTVKGAQGTAPYYGISSQRANHQIWFPHSTEVQAAGNHKNTITYVYEDGTPVLGTDGQPLVVEQGSDWTRNLKLDITKDDIQSIQEYARTHNADEVLNFIKNKYSVTSDTGWKVGKTDNTKTTYDTVVSPVLDGYTAEIKSTNANGVTVGASGTEVHAVLDASSIQETVVSNGQLTDAYKNGQTDGLPADYETVVVYKKVVAQKATVTVVDKDDNNKVLTSGSQTGNTGETISDTFTGQTNPALEGKTVDEIIAYYTARGYEVESNDYKSGTAFDNDADVDQNFTIVLKHTTETITPENPKKPTDPINPEDPNSPKYPSETQETNVKGTATLTVHYVDDAGNTVASDKTADVEVTRSVTIDKVTGQVISTTPWTAATDSYTAVATPVVKGYVATTETYDTNDGRGTITADKTVDGVKVVVNAAATNGDDATTDSAVTVVYKKVGNYIPVDSVTKEPIPGTSSTPYENDPDDPTKVTGTNTPTTPSGYDPQNSDGTNNSYTPNDDPTKDTEQPFKKTEVVEEEQRATLTFVDKDKNNAVLATASQTGKSGDPILDAFSGYSVPALEGKTIAEVIKYYEDRGYTLDSADYSAGTVFDDDSKVDQAYVVYLVHTTETITPENPKNPTDPINPDDPNSPTYPAETQESNVKGNATLTVHYVDEAGKSVATDKTISVDITRSVTIDKVTGEVISTTPWTAATDTYSSIATPVVEGYVARTETYDTNDGRGTITADKSVDSVKVVVNTAAKDGEEAGTDSVVTVVYNKVGNYIPVDSETNEPIPGTSSTPYQNDPEDPTKVIGNNTPTTPNGYDPQNPDGTNNSYTPNEDPTKDTEQPFKKTEDAQRATVTVVDKDDNNKVLTTASQTGKAGETISDTFTGQTNPVLEGKTVDEIIAYYKARGYEVESNDYKSGTAFDDDSKVDQNFTIVLKHITETITPENPKKPTDPINPEDPNSPTYPEETQESNVKGSATLTVHYVDEAGKTLSADKTISVPITRSVTIDKVTGQVISSTPWVAANDSYASIATPVVEGYVARTETYDANDGRGTIAADTAVDSVKVVVNADAKDGEEAGTDSTVTVVYKPVGSYVPVDPDGNPIGPKTPYTNDPNDPSKVVE
ncbi:mucin-binding protein, partial [Streptococcus sp. zg-JUN1979]|uniref:mucin-binding protein n=1 Tax=Streptococcus sp. zg-JUN1979 TaxID=3391450 RepID=UPI0039A60682